MFTLPALDQSLNAGLKATRRITKGQAIVSVPASKWITPSTVARTDIGSYVRQLQPWVQLAIFIMSEKEKSQYVPMVLLTAFVSGAFELQYQGWDGEAGFLEFKGDNREQD